MIPFILSFLFFMIQLYFFILLFQPFLPQKLLFTQKFVTKLFEYVSGYECKYLLVELLLTKNQETTVLKLLASVLSIDVS